MAAHSLSQSSYLMTRTPVGTLNHAHANAINSERAFPRLSAKPTYRQLHRIDEFDP
jgi:hypothetical protein